MRSLKLRRAATGSIAGALLVLAFTAASPAYADGLAGSWSGSGSVQLPTGDTEKTRCKATFHKTGGRSYAMSAVCASSSSRVAQTASLEQVGANRFTGDFTNTEYNVSGSIVITLNGNSLNASLAGGGGSAHISMNR